MPRVTACVSVLNQPELLKQTLESIQKQTFPDWECIVVDDGSTVPIKTVVDSFNDPRFIFHRFEKNRGIPHGANWAYKHAKGDYIQTLGCDEFIWEKKFEVQVAYLDKFQDVDLVWGVPGNTEMGPVASWEQYILRAHNRSREHWLKTFLLLESVPVGGASALWRKSVFESIGYFADNLTAFSDHEWFVRLIKKHKVEILPFRFMNEVPGHKSICTKTAQNAEKLDAEYKWVREQHPLEVRPTDGLISIGMPVKDHARFLKYSLRSVLQQTDQNFEVIIIDDGSTDNLEEELKKYPDKRISFFKNEKNEGHMATVNKLLAKAKGEFFISYSADDTMSPDFLEKCRNEFIKDPYLEYVASQNDFMKEDGTPWEGPHPFLTIEKAVNRPVNEWLERLRFGNVYFGIGMYRTSALRDVGGWDPKHGVISDYEMYLKLLPRYNCRIIEEPLTHTRIHGKNQSLLNGEEAGKLKRRYYDAQKSYYQPRPKVIIATPFYELKGFSPYIKSLTETTKLLTLHGIDWEFYDLSGDSYVDRARNSICATFLDDPWTTDLFFIDSDMAWDPHAFINMMFRPEPVIGGSYPVKNKWELWTSKPKVTDPERGPHFTGIPLPDGSALLEAHQLAGGFLRVKRSVLEKFSEFYALNKYRDTNPDPAVRKEHIQFFAAGIDRETEVLLLKDIVEAAKDKDLVDMSIFKERLQKLSEPRDYVGEDYFFSNRLRNMGIPLFIYPNATISHFGVQGWTGNFDTFLKGHTKEKPPETQGVTPTFKAN